MADQDLPPDPFAAFEGDRTVIKPSAGRGPRAASAGAAPAAAAPPAADATTAQRAAAAPPLPDLPLTGGRNPLLQAAGPLLAAAPRLRATIRHPNPEGLRQALVESVKRFESALRGQGLANEQVVAARYVLCTMLDEAAASTPWGGSGAWSSRSLLVHFHNESWGGEKVFQLLTRLAENPTQHHDLLELVHAALALGFEGRFRVLDNGRAQLDEVRQRLAQMLRQHRGSVERELSLHWRGVATPVRRLRDGIPLWAVAAGMALLLLAVFVGLRLSLNVQTDASFSALQQLGSKLAVAPAPPPPAVPLPPPPPRLAQLLKDDIAGGRIAVQDLADRSIVTVRGDGMFGAGSADLARDITPLLGRIGAALASLPGRVRVSGHSDNEPIRSLRFPSNWHLSKARAESVRDLLAASVKPERLVAEGRAESEPIDDNATAAGRARNRRVEITLTAAAPAS